MPVGSMDATLKRIKEALGSAHGPSALQPVVEALSEASERYSWVGIYLLKGSELVLAAWKGPQQTQHVRIPIGQGICGLAARTGEVVNVPDVSKDPRYLMCFPSTKSEIVVPIISSDGVLGEIDIDSDRLEAFSREDEEFLKQVADLLAAHLSG